MAIQTAMAIRNKGNFLLMAIRNYSVHRVRPLLPYGAILLFLGGIWFLWDGPSEGRQETIREQKMDTHSSAPDFHIRHRQKQKRHHRRGKVTTPRKGGLYIR